MNQLELASLLLLHFVNYLLPRQSKVKNQRKSIVYFFLLLFEHPVTIQNKRSWITSGNGLVCTSKAYLCSTLPIPDRSSSLLINPTIESSSRFVTIGYPVYLFEWINSSEISSESSFKNAYLGFPLYGHRLPRNR